MKILLIDDCSDCGKYFIRYGSGRACKKLNRKLKDAEGRIPSDCPLDDAEGGTCHDGDSR